MASNAKEKPISFRPDKDLSLKMEEWLEKNPRIDKTTLINLAIDKFISSPQSLMPVKLASDELVSDLTDELILKHKDALDKLK